MPAAAGLIAALALLAGCGSSSDDTSSSSSGSTTSSAAQADVSKSTVPRTPNAPSATKRPKGKRPPKHWHVPQAQGAQQRERISGLEGASTEQSLKALSEDVSTFWQGIFNGDGYRFQSAQQYVIVSGSVPTECGEITENDEPGYCRADNVITLPVPWFDQNAAPIGDFAEAYVIATLWGFQIENQLGLSEQLDESQSTLLADCLAGNWAASVYRKGALEEGDLDEGAQLIASTFGNENAQAHIDAFNTGYNSGQAANCPGIG